MSDRPAFEPWLGHLRQDRRGLPVPYINLWGAETVESTRIAYDPHVGQLAVYWDDNGDVPDFTKQAIQRQRECWMRGLCQVCARPVPWSRRNVIIANMSVDWVDIDLPSGRRVHAPTVTEPWLDDRCADIAINWCPALIRRTRDDTLTVHRVTSRRDVQMVISTGANDGFPETFRNPVAMWVKAAILNTAIIAGVQAAPQ